MRLGPEYLSGGKTMTKTLTPSQILERAEKALRTTRRRAQTLERDGYRIEPQKEEPGVYRVHCPGSRGFRYEVDLFNESCSCPLFFHHGDCKHLIATRAAVLKALELTSPLLPLARPLKETLQRTYSVSF
jgi:uncharacterized Zn finger protein